MQTIPKNLSSASLVALQAYLSGTSDVCSRKLFTVPELYRAIDDGLLLSLLRSRLGRGVERVWLPLESFENIEFHACMRSLKFHAQGREEQYVSEVDNGLKLLNVFVGLAIGYLDLGRLDELLSTTIAAIEAGPRMLREDDRWYLSNILFPFPGTRSPEEEPRA